MSQSARFATYPSLADRIVVITGGATGIGASMVEAFALQGAQIVILDIQQALLPGLIAGSASVINMGSISWAIPGIGLVPYIASKAAIVGLTKTLAHEFGPKGIRVNSIMPGLIGTDRQKRDVITPEYEAYALSRQALKRILHPDEVARMALWLTADDSSAVTNHSFVVDGGFI